MTDGTTDRIRLGTILAPSGVLVVIDPGYASLWTHAEEDFARDEGWPFDENTLSVAKTAMDITITGHDAAEAGRRFNRQWHNLWLYDIPEEDLPSIELSFHDLADAHGLQAGLEVSARRIPHRERVDYALAQGGGCGEIQIHGVMNAVCGEIPPDRELVVYAEPMPAGDYETRWRKIYVEVEPNLEIASSERIGASGVDWARLMFVDADALAHWGCGDDSLDGLADLVFWGRDAETLARELGAPKFDQIRYGWRDIPLDDVQTHYKAFETAREAGDHKAAFASWPHSAHWRLMRMVWDSPTESGSVELGGSRLCGFMTSWGDAIFDVLAERDAAGRLVRLTIDCGNEAIKDRQQRMEERWFGDLSKCAIATRSVVEGNKPVAFLFREEPVGDIDSGWVVTGGEDREHIDDADNVQLVRLRELIHLHPDLDGLFRSPVGSAFARRQDDDDFVAAAFPDLQTD